VVNHPSHNPFSEPDTYGLARVLEGEISIAPGMKVRHMEPPDDGPPSMSWQVSARQVVDLAEEILWSEWGEQALAYLVGRVSDRREGYQRLLHDARTGKFSHVAVENAERFGRNDAEALSAIDELHAFSVAVRFADYPDLDPIDPDDRIMVSLSFALARRESMKTSQRVRGGMFTKLEHGGHVGLAPDGYRNMERRTPSTEKLDYGRYDRGLNLIQIVE